LRNSPQSKGGKEMESRVLGPLSVADGHSHPCEVERNGYIVVFFLPEAR